MASDHKRHVIIVGGGASGVLLACHLLRDRTDDLRVTLIEKRPAVGRGMAYSTAQPGHLLNVRATNMSAFADDPLHFCRWLAENHEGGSNEEPGPLTFAQRRVYGRYIESLIAPLLWSEDRPGPLELVYGQALTLTASGDEARVTVDDGREITGDVAVLATGHEELPRSNPACYVSPWETPGDAGVGRDDAVLIRGTGLTMVDYVLSLRASGHRGPIYGMSRRGLLPQAHRPVSPLPIAHDDVPFGASLVTLWRWLRRLADQVTAQGGDWRSAVDGIRPYAWEIWSRLPFDSKQRFLRHARAWWEVHRHRMAPEVEGEIKAALASGQLRVLAAKTLSIVPKPGNATISFRRRGADKAETLTVTRVAECTGVYTDPLDSTNPVLRGLIADGLARRDPLGIGIDVAPDCAIVDRHGELSRRLFAVGPLTRAAFFEIMAVPDIRVQCAELAHQLRARLSGGSDSNSNEKPKLRRLA